MTWKDEINYWLRIPILIITIFGFYFLIRWLGVKGVVGLVSGMIIMAILILSDNKYFAFMIDLMEGKIDTKKIFSKK